MVRLLRRGLSFAIFGMWTVGACVGRMWMFGVGGRGIVWLGGVGGFGGAVLRTCFLGRLVLGGSILMTRWLKLQAKIPRQHDQLSDSL